jgi:hypothetical protein
VSRESYAELKRRINHDLAALERSIDAARKQRIETTMVICSWDACTPRGRSTRSGASSILGRCFGASFSAV